MKIKVLEKVAGCLPAIIDKGDWIDLITAEDVTLQAPHATTLHRYNRSKEDAEEKRQRDLVFQYANLHLGVAMEMPAGYEAVVVPRSSTFKNYGLILVNSVGVIDNSYKASTDEWRMPVLAFRNTVIPKGTRIAQFRVQLSQKATLWQRIKWLFSSGIKLEKVDTLDGTARGGFGSTGKSAEEIK